VGDQKSYESMQAGDSTEMTLALLGNTMLRTAITRNLVSFPAQIRPFIRRSSGDLQERIVQLYFVRGWSVRSISDRYGLSKAMAHKLLAEWRIRAIESGCIQEIEPGALSALVEETSVTEANADGTSVPMQVPVPMIAPAAFEFANVVSRVEHPVAMSAGSVA
jgi:transposase-like protein